MLLEIFDVDVNVYLSFAVIIATLTLSIIFSVIVPRKAEAEDGD
jgi:tellurite resistance protein TerC